MNNEKKVCCLNPTVKVGDCLTCEVTALLLRPLKSLWHSSVRPQRPDGKVQITYGASANWAKDGGRVLKSGLSTPAPELSCFNLKHRRDQQVCQEGLNERGSVLGTEQNKKVRKSSQAGKCRFYLKLVFLLKTNNNITTNTL